MTRKLLALWTAAVLLVLHAPTVLMVVFSFNRSRHPVAWTGFTLDWYRRLPGNRQIADALSNTLVISVASAVIATLLGTMAALALRSAFRGSRALRTFVELPLVIPDIVLAVGVLALVWSLDLRPGLPAAIAANATFDLAYVFVVVAARLEGLDEGAELAARDLGASRAGAFFRVTLPAILPGVASGFLLSFALTFDDFVVTYFTTGPGDTPLAVRIWSMMRGDISPEINAVSTVVLAISFVLVALGLALGRNPTPEERQ